MTLPADVPHVYLVLYRQVHPVRAFEDKGTAEAWASAKPALGYTVEAVPWVPVPKPEKPHKGQPLEAGE